MINSVTLLVALGTALANLLAPAPARELGGPAAKALVYCPATIDASGCSATVTALTGAFAGGVDRGYDGSNGTVDLAKVDLMQYSVLVVPSLADRGDSKPYARLRDPAIAGRLQHAFIGRLAFWSGTPDLGQSRRAEKDALIRNLAMWTSSNRAVMFRRGMVVLQDLSEDVTTRYDWVAGIARVSVAADPTVRAYAAVSTPTAAGRTLLDNGGTPLAYPNMAAFGLKVADGARAALDGMSEDGSGAALVTVSPDLSAPASAPRFSVMSAQSGGPAVTTDKGDYAPGEIVTITGTGWAAGETVHISLAEDPNQDGPHAWDVTADVSGAFADQSFWPGPEDDGVTFTLTATGASGTATTVFTDAAIKKATVTVTPTVATIGTPLTLTFVVNDSSLSSVDITSITIAVPGTFGSASVGSLIPPAGKHWTTAIVSGAITVAAVAGPDKLSPGESIQIPVTATPLAAGAAVWTTATNGNFDIWPGDPTVTVTPPACTAASITTQPTSQSVTYGSDAAFSAAATGTPAPTVQWQISTDNGASWNPITGATTTTLAVTAPAVSQSGSQYRAVFSNTCSGTQTATTSAATLTVNPRPVTITADAKSKVYGSGDPALTYQLTSGSLAGGDAFTGTLTRAAGEIVGSYTIQQGTLALSSNYSLAYVGANLQITPKQLTTPDATAQDKTYDGTTAAVISFGPLVGVIGSDAPTVTGTANFADPNASANVKTVNVTGIALSGPGAGNYTLSSSATTAQAKINPRPLTVTPNANQSKVYGDPDPVLAYTPGETLIAGNSFTGALGRVGGESIGNYEIQGGSLSAGSNYALTVTSGVSFGITTRPITVTADALSKVYGESEPPLTYHVTSGSLAFSDVFAGSLTRAPGNIVGTYPISQGTLALSSNYTLTFVAANLEITPKQLATPTVTADDKTYDGLTAAVIHFGGLVGVVGSDAPVISGTGDFENANASASLKLVNVTGIALTGPGAGNYTLSSATATAQAKINTRPIAVTPTANQSKAYGDADPAHLAFTPSEALIAGNSFSGDLARATGEDVGSYEILPGDLSAGTNYALSVTTGVKFTINPRPVTVTADAKSKVYGQPDPALTYQITSGNLVGSDHFTGTLTRTGTSNAGTYAIQLGTLALSTNYALTFVGADFVIRPKPLTTPTVTAKDKTYDGSDVALIEFGALVDLESGDVVTISGTGNFSDANAGNGKTVTVSNIELGGAAAGNYTVSPTTVTTTANLLARPITVTPNASQSKVYGEADPAHLAFTPSEALIAGNSFSGDLARATGEDVGSYEILPGSLSAGSNYVLSVATGVKFAITPRPVTVTADAKSKVYQQPDPALTYQITSGSLAFTDHFTGALNRVAGEMPGTYAIQQHDLALSANYTLTYVGASLVITNNAPQVTGITLPNPTLFPVGTAFTLGATFSDDDVGQTHTATIDWDDGALPQSVSLGTALTLTQGHTYTQAGVYTISVTVTDGAATGSLTSTAYVVVYDPSAGFVTGGGWIDSPVGACQFSACTANTTGKANFGFVAKYQKGQSTPTGNTEFQFKAGNLNFKSTSYQWLVVAGTKAQYKGNGTINGSGNYQFLITAIDGDSKNSGVDAFRIKITDGTNTVYDNKMGSSEDSSDATVLGGGSINIQAK